jgi:sulfate adenylyltransferase subunit 1
MEILRISTIGSVDHGKSTLIGRLFLDSKKIFVDQVQSIEKASKKLGEEFNLALVADGLKAEREQGITIDVAHKYFSTPNRRFILADTPGHVQYTRNMVTGASNSNAALIIIDANEGITEQTKRHIFISGLLQIPHLIVCVNKMDLLNYNQEVFNRIKREFEDFAFKIDIKDIHFIPISALHGDNVTSHSKNMPWYQGPSLLYLMENIYTRSDEDFRDCRFPVQGVIRISENKNPLRREEHRSYAGRIAGGVFKVGDKIRVLPSGFESKIKNISTFDGNLQKAGPKMSVALELEDDIDISRGDMIVRSTNLPLISQDIDLMICWLNPIKLDPARKYLVKHTTKLTKCLIQEIVYKIDINTLDRNLKDKEIGMNDIARIKIRTNNPLFFDSYTKNKITGSLILIDEQTNETIAAGMIR